MDGDDDHQCHTIIMVPVVILTKLGEYYIYHTDSIFFFFQSVWPYRSTGRHAL